MTKRYTRHLFPVRPTGRHAIPADRSTSAVAAAFLDIEESPVMTRPTMEQLLERAENGDPDANAEYMQRYEERRKRLARLNREPTYNEDNEYERVAELNAKGVR